VVAYKQEERDLVEKAVQILDDFGLYAMRDEYVAQFGVEDRSDCWSWHER